MASPEHEKLVELFSTAAERDTWAERNAYLDTTCHDERMRAKVVELLAAHDQAGAFLDLPPAAAEDRFERLIESDGPGSVIGRYKILREIGEGGYGTVLMAEQEEPIRRKVALKVIKLGMDTKQVIARFEAERQALALMDHPNIARVLDAGATETGRPYFVMELVKGITITDYCDQNRLSLRERLELFLPICHAVQHAHQKGIIHRDLKPNNVLVTLQFGQPHPKVIDFGIAKATNQRLTKQTVLTGFREFIGTLEYMSPEQADTSGLDVDTRADVYSLGALLYELLTGTTPFDGERLRKASLAEIRRIIHDEEPPKPSARLRSQPEAPADSHARSESRVARTRMIRGDLDWIVMKALEKDRTRRYATAKDLADDVERHLRHETVQAGPPSVVYSLRKFARRHRVTVLAAVVVGGALLIGLSVATLGLIEANRSRQELVSQRDEARAARESMATQKALAQDSAEKALIVNRFLHETLSSVDPWKVLGREVTIRYVLDAAAAKIEDGSLGGQDEVEASVRMTLGETYGKLGLFEDAERHLRMARSILVEQLGDEHADTLRSSRVLARLLRLSGKHEEAKSILQATAEIQRLTLGEAHRDTLTTLNELAQALIGPRRLEEARAIQERTLAIQRRILGEEDPDTLRTKVDLGSVLRELGFAEEARNLLAETLEVCERTLGEEHPCTTAAMIGYGRTRENLGEYLQAEELFRRAYELDCRILGTDHTETQIPMNSLVRVLRAQNKEEEVRPLVAARIARLKRLAEGDADNPYTWHAYAWELLSREPASIQDILGAQKAAERAVELSNERDASLLQTLARAQRASGRINDSLATERKALAISLPPGTYSTRELDMKQLAQRVDDRDLTGAIVVTGQWFSNTLVESMSSWTEPGSPLIRRSEMLLRQGATAEAISLLRECLAQRQQQWPEGHWLIGETMTLLGAASAGGGGSQNAEQLLIDGCTALEKDARAPATRRDSAIDRIVRFYESRNMPDQAARWRAKLSTQPRPGRDDS